MAIALVLNRWRQAPLEESASFAHVAERFRRAGELQRSVALCRDGLRQFPEHISARVTLGLALLDLEQYQDARVELQQALKRAPDNLAAIRGLAHLHDHGEVDLAVNHAWHHPGPDTERTSTAALHALQAEPPLACDAESERNSVAVDEVVDELDDPELDSSASPDSPDSPDTPRTNVRDQSPEFQEYREALPFGSDTP